MPELNWVGKDKVVTHHLDVPFRVLERQYSFDESGQHDTDNGSPNMIIHGDNLEALKALLPTHEGKVDCIYIDPPYNTGNEGWVYNDNVNDPQIKRWLGEVVGKEGEDLSRHDKWLCMMYPRLRLLHRLLAPSGAIFISIDDNEAAHLRLICDEIFGARCFVADISWQRTYSTRNDSKGIPAEVEHLLVYSKEAGWNPGKLERSAEMDAKYKNPDNDLSPWRSDNPTAPGGLRTQSMVYGIQHPVTGEVIYPPNGRCWYETQDKIFEVLNQWTQYERRFINDQGRRAEVCFADVNDLAAEVPALMLVKPLEEAAQEALAVVERGQWPRYFFTKMGIGGIARKTYLDSVGGALPTNFWAHEVAGHTDEAKKDVRAIFDGRVVFDTPKPVRLIERILAIATKPGDVVLDSFAGSGTTAQAVLNVNKRDDGDRTFILVELGDYADSVTAERVKRTIHGYKSQRVETHILFDQKLTVAALKKGEALCAEAQFIADEAEGKYSKVSKPKLVTTVSGKTASISLQVVAEQIHDEDVSGTGGAFSFFELGDPLFVDGSLNPLVDSAHILDYVWFTETGASGSRDETPAHPDFLGKHAGTGYFFAYDVAAVTTLDREYLATIPVECASESYVMYADLCTLSDRELAVRNITFKKIPRDITRL